MAWTCTSPPGVPKGMIVLPRRIAIAGFGVIRAVCPGRGNLHAPDPSTIGSRASTLTGPSAESRARRKTRHSESRRTRCPSDRPRTRTRCLAPLHATPLAPPRDAPRSRPDRPLRCASRVGWHLRPSKARTMSRRRTAAYSVEISRSMGTSTKRGSQYHRSRSAKANFSASITTCT